MGVIKCIIEFLIGREAHKQKKSSVHDLVNDKIIFVTAGLKDFFTKENLILDPMSIYA